MVGRRKKDSSIFMLGLDPGMSNTGYAIAEVDLGSRTIVRVLELGLMTTRRDNHPRVRRSSDDFRRARSLVQQLGTLVSDHKINVVASEMTSTVPKKRLAFTYGVMMGVLASLDQFVIEVLPKQVKLAVTGNPSAAKAEIIRWALAVPAGPAVSWPTSSKPNRMGLFHDGQQISLNAEHQADALAVIQAALASEQLADVIALQRALG